LKIENSLMHMQYIYYLYIWIDNYSFKTFIKQLQKEDLSSLKIKLKQTKKLILIKIRIFLLGALNNLGKHFSLVDITKQYNNHIPLTTIKIASDKSKIKLEIYGQICASKQKIKTFFIKISPQNKAQSIKYKFRNLNELWS